MRWSFCGGATGSSRPRWPCPWVTEVSEDGEGGGNGRAAGGSQLDTPSDEPFVGKDRETTDLNEELSALGIAVAKAADLDDPELVAPKRHGSFGSGGGIYGGFGDGRGLGHGPGKPGCPGIGRSCSASNTLDAYAGKLDFFKHRAGDHHARKQGRFAL